MFPLPVFYVDIEVLGICRGNGNAPTDTTCFMPLNSVDVFLLTSRATIEPKQTANCSNL